MAHKSLYSIFYFWSFLFSLQSIANTFFYNDINSPYYITSNLVFSESDTVIFEAGATLIVSPGVDIRLKGLAYFNGGQNNPISFLPLDSALGWGRLYFDNFGIQSKHYYLRNVLIVDGLIDSHYAFMHISHLEMKNDQDLLWDDNFIYIRKGWAEVDSSRLVGINDGEGIQFLGASFARVSYCHFLGTPDAIELINVDQGELLNNSFRNISDDAIDLNHSNNTIIKNNFISNVSDRGMEIGSENFGSSINILIEHNIIENCNVGIIFKEGSEGTVLNNTLHNNNIAISCLELVGGAGGSSVSVENTIFSNSQTQDLQKDLISNIDVSYSLSNSGILSGSNNLFDEPLFVDESIQDFSLDPYSACINNGNPYREKDLDCTISDIGALYYHQEGQCETIDFSGVKVFPTLFSQKAEIVYELKKEGNVVLAIFNDGGQEVATLVDAIQEKGIHKITLKKQRSSGVYFVSLSFDNKVFGAKAIQLKN